MAPTLCAPLALLFLVADPALPAEPAPGTASLPGNQVTLDVDAVSLTVTYAWPVAPGVLFGGGVGAGVSPILGRFFTSNEHYAPVADVHLLELFQMQLFARFEPASWLSIDTGLRAAAFLHEGVNSKVGALAGPYVAPALRLGWLSVGPRVTAGLMTELWHENSGMLAIDYLIARITFD
jgi:hypothetical protein